MTSNQLCGKVAALRAQTKQPFNLNFFADHTPVTSPAVLAQARDRLRPWLDALGLGEPPATPPNLGPPFDEARLSLLLDLRPAVVGFHFGLP